MLQDRRASWRSWAWNKQQPAKQSLFSWGVALLQPNLSPAHFVNQVLEGMFKKAYHVSRITAQAVHAVIAFITCPILRIWKWWKDRFWYWFATCRVGQLKPMQVYGAGLVPNVPQYSNCMCLYSFFQTAGNFGVLINHLDSEAQISSRTGIHFHFSSI